jgi:hypothetical protein
MLLLLPLVGVLPNGLIELKIIKLFLWLCRPMVEGNKYESTFQVLDEGRWVVHLNYVEVSSQQLYYLFEVSAFG